MTVSYANLGNESDVVSPTDSLQGQLHGGWPRVIAFQETDLMFFFGKSTKK